MKKKEDYLLEKLSDFYIFIILLIFPIAVNHTGFFHILEFKWSLYFVITISYILLCTLIFLYFLIAKKINYFKNRKISKVEWLMLLLLAINILSYLLSPYRKSHNLFLGAGRGEGLLMSSLYIISFLFLSFFTKFKKRHINYFSISSIIFSFIVILQYIGFNPFNIYQNGIGTFNTSFIGTIGNVDFVSAYYTMFLSISFSSFVFLKEEKWEKIIHFLSFLMGFFVFGVISVKSGVVAFALSFVILVPFLFSNNERLSRTILLSSSLLFAYAFNIFLNPVYYYGKNRILLEWNFSLKFLIFIIIIVFMVLLSFYVKGIKFDLSKKKKLLKKYYLFLVCMVGFVIVFLFLFDLKSGFFHEIHCLLHGDFNDNYGTYRIFLWKITLNMIERPLFGIGPDAFAIPFMQRYTLDIIKIGPYSINDTAANIYLTMLINIGIVGLMTYILFIIEQIKVGIRKMNKYNYVFLIAIICYSIQAFFNLSVVLITPFIYLIFALSHVSIIDKNKSGL